MEGGTDLLLADVEAQGAHGDLQLVSVDLPVLVRVGAAPPTVLLEDWGGGRKPQTPEHLVSEDSRSA